MAELTIEERNKAETMPLDQLRLLADKEPEPEPAHAPVPEPTPEVSEEEHAEEPDAPQTFRREIENGDGSIDVYEADSLEELVDKIAEGKRNANAKIRELAHVRRQEEATQAQNSEDLEYIIKQRLEKEPRKAISEIVREVIGDEQAKLERSNAIQSLFVTEHPEYVPSPDNGARLTSEYRRLYPNATEFTATGLEKAYESLKASGLVRLREEQASAATEGKTAEPRPTDEIAAEPTQQRSPKRSSTIRSTAPPATNVGPTEDELYSMPLEKLRELADKQLREAARQ